MVNKNVHNHCIFGLLTHTMRIVIGLGLDKFMENPKFYDEFMQAHVDWIAETRKYYKIAYGVGGKTVTNKAVSVIERMEQERSKLESLEEHLIEVCHICGKAGIKITL